VVDLKNPSVRRILNTEFKLKGLKLIDYLLLDYMALSPIPFFILFKSERINKPDIDLSITEIALHINFLNKNKLISILDENDEILKLSKKTIYSILKQAYYYNHYTQKNISLQERVIAPKKNIYPRLLLTDLGVERWEDFFKPDWSKYCSETEFFSEKIDGECKVVYEALNKKVIQKMNFLSLKYETPYLSEWKTIKPWKPFYWKKFELGYALELSFLENNVDIEYLSEDVEKIHILRKWKKEWKHNYLEGLY